MEDKKNNQVINEPERGDRSTLNQYQKSSIIKAIGVGGGGINAVNQMLFHIKDINYVVLDSDSQQLNRSSVPNRVLLRPDTTHRIATEESESEIAALFDDDTKMVIIIAGLGGETGTDVAPVVARIAQEKEIVLTVGVVTIPFQFEGTERIQMALAGIEEMRKHVDALFVINNEHLTEINNDLNPFNAFLKTDEALTTVISSLYCLITPIDRRVCMDFNDVNYTLRKGGNAFIVSGFGSGERRVTKALENAFESPLLKDCDKYSFKKILMSFLYNPDSESPLLMEDMNEVEEFMINLDQDAICICYLDCDRTLDNRIKVTVLASGFNTTYGQYLASLLQDKSNQ